MAPHPLAVAWSRLRRLPWREIVGPLLITTLVAIVYRRLLGGDFPISHDHPAHMFNAWLTSDELLPRGHVAGWSDLWFAGYPANDLYGPGGSLWVSLFRALTFYRLGYGETYGLAIFGLLLLVPLSTYVLGRAFLGATTGTIAGLLMVLTKGGWYDLGWFWILEMGVWPFALGAALSLIALAVLRRYLRQGGARGLAAAALAIGAALVGHPMSLMAIGIAGPLLVLYLLLERGQVGATRVLVRSALAVGLAVVLCGAWLVPFITKSAYTQKLGETWMQFSESVPAVTQLDLFGPEWRFVSALSVCGIVLAIVRRNVWALYLATTGMAMMLLSSSDVLYGLRLFDVASPLASIQFPRFLGFVRVFVYLLAGYAVRELFGMLRAGLADPAHRAMRLRVALAAAVPAVFALPFSKEAVRYAFENHLTAHRSLATQEDLPWWPDFLSAAEYVKERMEGEPWSRVAAIGSLFDHVFSTLPVWTGLPVYTGGALPAHTYRFFFDNQRDTKTLRAVGVRYVLAMGDFGARRGELRLRETFGAIRVYELEGAEQPRRMTPIGRCQVDEVAIDDEQMVADVSGTDGPCRVRLHRGDFPNWRATLDGEPLDIQRVATWPGSTYQPFMSVVVPRDGRLTVAWEETPGDRVGVWLTVLGCLVLLGLGVVVVRPRWRERLVRLLPEPSPRLRLIASRGVWFGAAGLVVLVAAVGIARSRETAYTFDRHVDEAERFIQRGDDRLDCRPAETGGGWRCGEPWDRVDAGVFSFVYDTRYCVFAHPSPLGVKHLLFRDVPLGRRLSGFYGLLDTSQGVGPVSMDVSVGGAPPVRLSVKDVGRAHGFDLQTEPGVADVDVAVSAAKPEWRHLCFNLIALDE